jgi:hypothetical protein
MKNIYSLAFRKLTAILVFILASAGLIAQVNFSGTWAFNESKSNFGDMQFRPYATTIVIIQEGNNLSAENTFVGPDGNEMKITNKYTLDGQVSENQGFRNTVTKSVVTWSADKTALTIATTMTFERDGQTVEFKPYAIWKLTDEGKTLLLENSFTPPDGGEVKYTVAYDRK